MGVRKVYVIPDARAKRDRRNLLFVGNPRCFTCQVRSSYVVARVNKAASFPPGLPREPFPYNPAKRAVPSAAQPAPSLGKRPSTNVNMDEIRKQVSDTIRKALPAIVASQSTKQNGNSSG
jgi:hypothetical protein